MGKIFEVELPNEEPMLTTQRGLQSSWRARQTEQAVEERREHLWQIGQTITTHQREYFESSNAHEAYLELKPLTQDEVARELGITKDKVSRLLKKAFVFTPRFGMVALDVFFGLPVTRLGCALTSLPPISESSLKARSHSSCIPLHNSASNSRIAGLFRRHVQVPRRHRWSD